MQKWEYKALVRRRSIKASKNNYLDAGPWEPNVEWSEIETLGEQGWELIAVASLSDYGGKIDTDVEELASSVNDSRSFAVMSVTGKAVAGLTTSQVFYFKRPKQG